MFFIVIWNKISALQEFKSCMCRISVLNSDFRMSLVSNQWWKASPSLRWGGILPTDYHITTISLAYDYRGTAWLNVCVCYRLIRRFKPQSALRFLPPSLHSPQFPLSVSEWGRCNWGRVQDLLAKWNHTNVLWSGSLLRALEQLNWFRVSNLVLTIC